MLQATEHVLTDLRDVGLVTPNYFDGLGLTAALGRTLRSDDDVTGERRRAT